MVRSVWLFWIAYQTTIAIHSHDNCKQTTGEVKPLGQRYADHKEASAGNSGST